MAKRGISLKQTVLLGVGAATMAGMLGGVGLGRYATGDGMRGPVGAMPGDNEDYAFDTDKSAGTGSSDMSLAAAASGPENYTCKGCGPSLWERRTDMQPDAYEREASRGGYRTYDVVHVDDDAPYDEPVDDAGRWQTADSSL